LVHNFLQLLLDHFILGSLSLYLNALLLDVTSPIGVLGAASEETLCGRCQLVL
jgi:hypothetical protein